MDSFWPWGLLLGLALWALILWAFGMYFRKRFVILYHSQALDEIRVQLERIANALESRTATEKPGEVKPATPGEHLIPLSMFGR